MIFYRKLDTMSEYRTQFAFKGKREHIAKKVNISNLAYPTYWYSDKTCSIVNNLDLEALVKKSANAWLKGNRSDQ